MLDLRVSSWAMNKPRPRKLRLEPSVSEGWVRRVMMRGASPNHFAEFLLERADLETWLARYEEVTPTRDSKEDRAAPVDRGHENVRRAAESRRPLEDEEGWSEDLFFDFLEVTSQIPDLEWSIALLQAYLKLGPMPSSAELQALCSFDDDSVWHQQLRIAKQRLTLQARKMGAPALFPRAKTGVGGKRQHPIEPLLFPWLRKWAETRGEGEGVVDGGGLPEPEHWGTAIRKSDQHEEEPREHR